MNRDIYELDQKMGQFKEVLHKAEVDFKHNLTLYMCNYSKRYNCVITEIYIREKTKSAIMDVRFYCELLKDFGEAYTQIELFFDGTPFKLYPHLPMCCEVTDPASIAIVNFMAYIMSQTFYITEILSKMETYRVFELREQYNELCLTYPPSWLTPEAYSKSYERFLKILEAGNI